MSSHVLILLFLSELRTAALKNVVFAADSKTLLPSL